MATTGDWLSVIYEISKVINASLELPEILGVIARETGRFVPFDCLEVGLVESDGQRLRLYVAAAPGRGPELDGATVELQGSLLGHVIQIREPLVVPDLRGAGGLPGAEALAAEGMVSSVALPLVSGAKVLGAFVAARADFRPFEPPEVDMLLEVAEQTAIAVDHARLYAAEKKRSSHLAIINEVARRVLSTFDLDTLLQQTASLIQQRFAYYDVGIFLTDRRAAEVVLRAQAGAYTDESVVGYRQPIGVGMVGWCAKTGRSLLASDVRKNPHYIVAFDGERSARAELCVPIKIGGQVAGVINVESTQAGAFDQTDVTALDTLSDQVAQAIENARLYDEMRYLRELDRSILASIPSSIFVVDRNLVVVTVNEMCCRVLERGREQVVGEGLEGLLSFEELSPETLRRTVARVIDDDERHEFPNVRARLPSGAQRIVDVHLSPVARRTQRRALLFINDITERRRAEEGVLREKQKLDNIVSAIGAGLLVIDPDFTIAWSNPTCDEWFGDGASLVGTSCHDICPRRHGSASGPDVLCDDCLVLSSLSTGQVRTVPQVVMGAQRPVRHYQNIFAPIRDEGGQIVQVIRVTFDVTDQARKVEQIALLQKLSEAMQGTLELDRLLHLILTCVTAGPGLGFNRAILLLLDDSRTVLEGRLGVGPSSLEEAARIWRELSEHPQSLEHLLDRFDEPVAPGDQSMQSVSRQIRIPLEATDEAPVRAVLDKRPVVIRDTADAAHADASLRSPLGSDQFVCVPLVTRDQALGAIIADNIFTRRPIRDADVEMLRTFAAHAGLAISAASAYRKLEEQLVALEEAQDQIVRSERLATVGKLAAHVAHEIRNPLATIGGFTRSILRTPGNAARVRRNADIILDEVVRLEHILANVMNFTKPGDPIFRDRDINEFVDAVCAFHENDLAEQHIALHKSLDPHCPVLRFDPDQIRQVLINLIQNALDAMPDGGELTVMTRLQDDHVEIVVADTGTGMSKAVAESLFEPFFTTKVGGTGLGLSVSQKIAHSHGGDILVQSRPGAGSSITLCLPIPDRGLA